MKIKSNYLSLDLGRSSRTGTKIALSQFDQVKFVITLARYSEMPSKALLS